jgi:peptidoglycan/xylan/chitin deacetylase (PgdA/CDA1 family)
MAQKKNKHSVKVYAGTLLVMLAIVCVSLFAMFVRSYLVEHSPQHSDRYVDEIPSDIQKSMDADTDQTGMKIRIPILIYHYVERITDKRDTIRASLNIYPQVLRSQIRTLKDAGYLFITPSYISMALSGKIKPAEKVVMLTFDDGYRDFYTDVFPILEEEQVKAVAYVVPNFLDKPNFMFTSQLLEVANSPYVEIGAHTMDHAFLRGMDRKTAQFEIAQSKKSLERLLHTQVRAFAYPYGGFDKQAIELAAGAGFTTAVSTVPGITQTPANKYFLYRLRPGDRTGEALLRYLSQDTFSEYK